MFLGLFLLIPKWGIWGAIAANLGGNIFMLTSLAFVAQRYFYVPMPLTFVLGIPLLVGLLFLGFEWGVHLKLWSYSIMGISQFVVVASLLVAFNYQSILQLLSYGKKILFDLKAK